MISFPSCRYKVSNGELQQVTSDVVLRKAVANLEDGFRLTMWAYEKNEVRWGGREDRWEGGRREGGEGGERRKEGGGEGGGAERGRRREDGRERREE